MTGMWVALHSAICYGVLLIHEIACCAVPYGQVHSQAMNMIPVDVLSLFI